MQLLTEERHTERELGPSCWVLSTALVEKKMFSTVLLLEGWDLDALTLMMQEFNVLVRMIKLHGIQCHVM